MKDKKKKVKKIAQKIVELENKCQLDKTNINKYLTQMQQLTEHLSLEELLAVDEYILENKLLTK